MPDQSYNAADDAPGAMGYAAVGLAWLIPGVGHYLIGQRGRGLLFMVTIHLLFAAGLLIGGIHAMNPDQQPIWSYTQLLAGWPTLAANTLARHESEAETVARRELDSNYRLDGRQRAALSRQLNALYAPKIQDVGTVYCGLAGMLNLLLIFDVLVRVAAPKDGAA